MLVVPGLNLPSRCHRVCLLPDNPVLVGEEEEPEEDPGAAAEVAAGRHQLGAKHKPCECFVVENVSQRRTCQVLVRVFFRPNSTKSVL